MKSAIGSMIAEMQNNRDRVECPLWVDSVEKITSLARGGSAEILTTSSIGFNLIAAVSRFKARDVDANANDEVLCVSLPKSRLRR
jgi:hypothetical protein